MTDDFSGLGLSTKVTDAVTSAGYTTPTEIQAQAIPHILEKKDVIGIAQTGTGKTASFVLPMLHLLENGRARARMPRTLILEPTRELAAQVSENFEKYGKNHRLTMALIIGGVSFEDQNKKLDRGVDVLIATPGRLLDQIERGKIMLNGVEILVIDEADRMLDMGFIDDIEKIVNRLPPRRQTMLFSATMDAQIEKLTKKFLKDPVHVQVSRAASTADTIDQKLVKVGSKPEEKRAALRERIAAADGLTNAIIFCNRKRDVATLARSLERHGFSAGGLHGDMDQKSRTETLDAFKNNRLTLLVASDVAARGLDIPAVSHVFNFDVPVHAEDYVHRIGRTGRAGRLGVAYTLVAPADGKHLDAILKLIQKPIEWLEVSGKPAAAAAPVAEAEEGAERPARPARSRRGGPRNRADAPAAEEAPPARAPRTRPESEKGEGAKPRAARAASAEAAPAEPVAADEPTATVEPVKAERSQRPARGRGRPRPEADEEPSASNSNSPFGNDGPVPAFLLRPTRIGS
ncbi:MAG: DEAD/DEAH box helicase [Alphaproteobacteria bacterium]|nr:DEAD/DEAH box helicase [Alphaproteobacteria bacterium]MBU1560904.1 DEAD/DEAH box helicase [Alphaproteobacteria bacterium]MBU2304878.1 DEAD/DEAH box helicase [Alphaproteobacteria bacterium]MBU2370129.1 DEAD/DEAH box helicase [Alphaproteobacteria bacterium]